MYINFVSILEDEIIFNKFLTISFPFLFGVFKDINNINLSKNVKGCRKKKSSALTLIGVLNPMLGLA